LLAFEVLEEDAAADGKCGHFGGWMRPME
jgi:hypothetical protein